MGQIKFLETVPQSDGLPEINQDYLCHLEYRRRTVPLDEPEFWLVTTALGISPDEVVRCILGGLQATIPPAVRSINPSLFHFTEEK